MSRITRVADVPGLAGSSAVSGASFSATPVKQATGIVLAGTYRWGGTSFESTMRGPMMPVALAPLVSYPIAWLRDQGVRSVILCANSWTPSARASFGDGAGLGVRLDYYEDASPRGAAGCVRDAIAGARGETFVVVEGAIVPAVDLGALLETHRRSGAAMTIVAEIDRRRGSLGRTRLPSPGGIHVFERRALDLVPGGGFQDIKEGLIERLYRSGAPVATYEVQGLSPRIIDRPSYLAVNRWLTERLVAEPAARHLDGYVRRGDALCHPTARVDERARVIGPVLVGAHADIERDAVIVGPSAVGHGCRIGRAALLTRSVLWNDCTVGAGVTADDVVLAEGASLTARSTAVPRDRAWSAAAWAEHQRTFPVVCEPTHSRIRVATRRTRETIEARA